MALWVFSYGPPCRVRAVPCLHLSRAGGDQGYASPLRSPGPSFPSAVIFGRSPAQVSRSHPPTPVSRVLRLRLPLRPVHPRLIARLLWGTAPPGVAEYVNNGGKHHAIAKPVTLNVEECDRLSFLPYRLATIFCMPRRMCTRWRKK